MLNTPLQMMLVAIAGWINEQQLAIIEYKEGRAPSGGAPQSAP